VRIATAVACAVLLLLALQAALSRALPLDALIEKWATNLGVPVRVDSATARLLPYPSVRLEGLAFERDITIERAVVKLRILALLRGGFEGGRVRIRGAHVTLLRRADGSVQLGDLATAVETGDRAKPASRPRALPALPHAELRDTVIRYVDHTVSSGQQVTELHLRTTDVRTHHASDELEIHASGRLDSESGSDSLHVAVQLGAAPEQGKRPLSVDIQMDGIDPARVVPHLPRKWGIRAAVGSLAGRIFLAWGQVDGFDGELDLHFSPGTADYAGVHCGGQIDFQAQLHDDGEFSLTDGRVRADTASFGPIDARELKGRLGYTKHVVTFDALEFEGWGGSVSAKGTLTVEHPLAFDLELAAKGLAPERFGQPDHPLPDDPMRMDAEASLRGNWQGGADWLVPIHGSARLSMQGGQVPSGKLLDTLVERLPSHWPRHEGDTPHKSLDTTPLQRLSASFDVEGERAYTRDLTLVTEEYNITAEGSIGSSSDYAFDGAFAFAPKGLMRLLAAARIDGRPDQRGKAPKVPFKVTGNLADGSYSVHVEQQPLTALVIIPLSVHGVTETTSDALEAGERAVGSAVDWLKQRGDEGPNASTD